MTLATQQYPVQTDGEFLSSIDSTRAPPHIGTYLESWRPRVVIERLDFLRDLEESLFHATAYEQLAEAAQWRALLLPNTWLFGDEFLLAVEDRPLSAAICVCVNGGQRNAHEPPTTTFAVRVAGGICDAHLVVLVRSAGVQLGGREVGEIEEIAASISSNEQCRSGQARWTFLSVGGELGVHARFRDVRGHGCILQRDGITVIMRSWRQIIDENRARLRSFLGTVPDAQFEVSGNLAITLISKSKP